MFKLNTPVLPLIRNLSALQLQLRCSSDSQRQSKMLQKLMSGKRKPVFKFQDSHAVRKSEPIFATRKVPTKLTTRRTTVLNKMFMRHITELIASGPIGPELIGTGLEITRVKVCQNDHGLNIFWIATGTDDFDYVDKKLASINKSLRHDLHQMQLMGNIPHLTFVRDEQLSYLDELDSIIENADYGDDYKPSFGRLKTNTDLEPLDDAKVPQNQCESSLPPMRNDVFGLDHSLIMGRVKQSMAKSKQAWKIFEDKQLQPTTSTPFSFNTSFEDIRQEEVSKQQTQDVLKEFLQKRKLQRKLRRAEDTELNARLIEEEEELERRSAQNDEDDFDFDFDFQDEFEEQKFYDDSFNEKGS